MPTSRKGESTTTTMRADSLLARCCPPFNSCPWPCVMFPFFFKPSPIFWDRRWEWAWVVARLYVYKSFFFLFFLFTRVCKRIKRDNPAMQCCLMGGKKLSNHLTNTTIPQVNVADTRTSSTISFLFSSPPTLSTHSTCLVCNSVQERRPERRD